MNYRSLTPIAGLALVAVINATPARAAYVPANEVFRAVGPVVRSVRALGTAASGSGVVALFILPRVKRGSVMTSLSGGVNAPPLTLRGSGSWLVASPSASGISFSASLIADALLIAVSSSTSATPVEATPSAGGTPFPAPSAEATPVPVSPSADGTPIPAPPSASAMPVEATPSAGGTPFPAPSAEATPVPVSPSAGGTPIPAPPSAGGRPVPASPSAGGTPVPASPSAGGSTLRSSEHPGGSALHRTLAAPRQNAAPPTPGPNDPAKRVHLHRPGTDVDADELSGNVASDVFVLKGNVTLHSDPKIDRGIGAETESDEPLTITADQLDIDRLGLSYVAKGHVHFVQGARSGTADLAMLNEQSHTLDLIGNADVREGERRAAAAKMHYDTRDKQFRGAGNVRIYEPVPTRAAKPSGTPAPKKRKRRLPF